LYTGIIPFPCKPDPVYAHGEGGLLQ
jgi:hypothetical protein